MGDRDTSKKKDFPLTLSPNSASPENEPDSVDVTYKGLLRRGEESGKVIPFFAERKGFGKLEQIFEERGPRNRFLERQSDGLTKRFLHPHSKCKRKRSHLKKVGYLQTEEIKATSFAPRRNFCHEMNLVRSRNRCSTSPSSVQAI